MKIAPFYKWLNIKLTYSHYSSWFGIVSYTVFFPGSLLEGKLNELYFVCLLFMGMNNASMASITELMSITERYWPQMSFYMLSVIHTRFVLVLQTVFVLLVLLCVPHASLNLCSYSFLLDKNTNKSLEEEMTVLAGLETWRSICVVSLKDTARPCGH